MAKTRRMDQSPEEEAAAKAKTRRESENNSNLQSGVL